MILTNALRLLHQAGIEYRTAEYPVVEGDYDGGHVADLIGLPREQVFKTLVTRGAKGECFVFVVPVCEELDLKKAARAAGRKSIEMLPLRDLTPTTGYVRGGCSPVGMKKKLPTVIDETAQLFDEIAVSAGMRGLQLILSPDALAAFVGASFADIT